MPPPPPAQLPFIEGALYAVVSCVKNMYKAKKQVKKILKTKAEQSKLHHQCQTSCYFWHLGKRQNTFLYKQLCRASMHSFFVDCQSLRELRITSVLIIAAIKKKTWVGFKCNGPVNFFSERRYFKYNTCVFPPCPPPPLPPPRQASSPLLGNPPPFLSSQAPLLSRCRDISGSGAPTGVFSPEKGDPSDMTGSAGICDGSEPWEN